MTALPNNWWYDCLPWCDPSPRMHKEDPSRGKDPLQWSGMMFLSGKNIYKVDFLAMLGRVYLGKLTDLCMPNDPSVPLLPEWQFAPVTQHGPSCQACVKRKHMMQQKKFYHLFDNYTYNRDPVMVSTIPMLLCFCSQFFKQSRALMVGFKSLTFSYGLDYATTASTFPEHVSFWHFVPSLDDLPEGKLTSHGLSPHQLAQLLTNYWGCLAQVFANGWDYHCIPPEHKSPVPWCSTFYGALPPHPSSWHQTS